MDSVIHSVGEQYEGEEVHEAKGLPHTFSPLSITQSWSDQNLGLLRANGRSNLCNETGFSMDSSDDFEEVFPLTFSVDNTELHQYISPASSASSSCGSFVSSLDDMLHEVSNSQFEVLSRDATMIKTKVSEEVKLQSPFCYSLLSASGRRNLFSHWVKRDIDNEGNQWYQSPQERYKRKLALRASTDI